MERREKNDSEENGAKFKRKKKKVAKYKKFQSVAQCEISESLSADGLTA